MRKIFVLKIEPCTVARCPDAVSFNLALACRSDADSVAKLLASMRWDNLDKSDKRMCKSQIQEEL